MLGELLFAGVAGFGIYSAAFGSGECYTNMMISLNKTRTKNGDGIILQEDSRRLRIRSHVFGYIGQVVKEFSYNNVHYAKSHNISSRGFLETFLGMYQNQTVAVIPREGSMIWEACIDLSATPNDTRNTRHPWLYIKDNKVTVHQLNWYAPFEVKNVGH